MEEDMLKSPQLGSPTDIADAKYVSGLSTILVATIQETKDRISQIEYIFCSQLFPNFQSKSKSMQKFYFEAKKTAEDAWKEKEKDLILQMEKLQSEKQHVLEENKSLKLASKFYFEANKAAEDALKEKEKDLLLQIEIDKENQLKEYEEKTNKLLAKLKNLEENVDELQRELAEKNKEVDKGKELQENLLQSVESLTLTIVNNEQFLNNYEKEKRLLTAKLESLENNADGLRTKLGKKIEEAEESRKLQEQSYQQIELKNSEILKTGQELEELNKEKKLILTKLKDLGEKVDKLQVDLRESNNESTQGMELHRKLLQQIEAKDTELLSEKNKRRDVIVAYKKLKSQYNFLCTKFGLTTENMIHQGRTEDESDSLRRDKNPSTSSDIKDMIPNASFANCEITEHKDDHANLDDPKGFRLIQKSSSDSPSSSRFPNAPIHSTDAKSGTKRPVSYWRDTRSHQNRAGPDPHDDFLDTPLENIRGNLKKSMKEVHDLPDPVPNDMNFNISDDETEDLNVDLGPQKQQMPPPRPATRDYKFVEPVRKKAERENLKGVECKQCKKFYDAVLPDGGKNTEGDKQNFRCEHQDGVSRHRYRYAPPLTPEGFWNIGFESEM